MLNRVDGSLKTELVESSEVSFNGTHRNDNTCLKKIIANLGLTDLSLSPNTDRTKQQNKMIFTVS